MTLSIKVEHLSKAYQIGEFTTGTVTRDIERWWALLRGKEDPFTKIGETNDRSSKGTSDVVWSLNDINFEIQQGEAVGIIGKNGAGKSTLLKILSQVTTPTSGNIKIKGRIASLLEVGTGFHPELTGRENIYINGAILGMRKTEITKKLDEIIDFSGVERYIDTPVKRYSSGMYVRLAFAVAAHLESEILIVDEVLAVGDAEFQKKCLGKMGEVSKGEGRTVLFVSHNMAAVQSLCKSGILLQNGKLDLYSSSSDVIQAFNCAVTSLNANQNLNNNTSKPVCLKSINIDESKLEFSSVYERVLDVEVEIYENFECIYSIEFLIRDSANYPIAFVPYGFTVTKHFNSKGNQIIKKTFFIELPFLASGEYQLDVMLVEPNVRFYQYLESIKTFSIHSAIIPETGWNFQQLNNQGSILCVPKLIQEEYL